MDRTEPSSFNTAADVTYGLICCLSFLIGTLGNIVSFLYFKSKKRDISSATYMMITLNDMVISLLILPVGILFLFKRQPSIIFGNEYGCAVWSNVWYISLTLSIFLVICLSTSRTISMLRPFKQQKIRYLLVAVMMNLMLQSTVTIGFNMMDGFEIIYSNNFTRCDFHMSGTPSQAAVLILNVSDNVSFLAPAFVVAISCTISVGLLRRKNDVLQQRELQRSRRRATETILLFALLYGICNVPLVFDFILLTCSKFTEDPNQWHLDRYKFDTHYYYFTAMRTLLLAVNSAANPVLYFWRMPRLRENVMKEVWRRSGDLSRERSRSVGNNEEERCSSRVTENIIVVPDQSIAESNID